MTNRKKALFFLQAGVGGAERMTVLIGKLLDPRKFEVKFYPVQHGDTASAITNFVPSEYETKVLPSASPFQRMKQFYRILKNEKPDVVFSSVLYINNKILPLRWLFPNTKFIIRCENYLYTFSKKQKSMMWVAYRMADYIIAQTDEMKQELVDQLGINTNKVFALQNPLDTQTIEQKMADAVSPYPENGKKHFVASGRFAYQKGFDILVEAFAKVAEKRKDVDLYIIGAKDGDHQKEYERVWSIVKEKGLEDMVHCEGFQNNPYPYVRFADCFILSSRWEGLPNVLIEALHLGTPTAALKCIPVVERIVSEGKDGYLAGKESVEELAEAMAKAVDMGRIQSSYQSSKPEDFTRLFEEASGNVYLKLLRLGGGKITTREELKFWIKTDFDSYKMEHPMAARFTYGENWELFAYMRNLRYLEYYTNKDKKSPWDKFLKAYHWLKHRRNCKKMDIFLAPNCVGPGLHFQHRGFRHILPGTIIGSNCEILPMVLMGKKTQGLADAQIQIGDNCYIATGVTILGPVNIGNNVTIAAGAVVTKDIPDNCIAGGVPAKIIKQKE